MLGMWTAIYFLLFPVNARLMLPLSHPVPNAVSTHGWASSLAHSKRGKESWRNIEQPILGRDPWKKRIIWEMPERNLWKSSLLHLKINPWEEKNAEIRNKNVETFIPWQRRFGVWPLLLIVSVLALGQPWRGFAFLTRAWKTTNFSLQWSVCNEYHRYL